MKRLLLFLSFIITAVSFSQTSAVKWTSNPFENNEFVENNGQFTSADIQSDETIYFVVNKGMKIFFTKKGLVYRYDEIKPKYNERELEKERRENKTENEEKEKTFVTISHYMCVEWENANPAVEVIAGEKLSYYINYPDVNSPVRNKTIKANVFKKIIYKNVYLNIDVEYYFSDGKEGIKYNILLHPGADVSLIKMKYSGYDNIKLNSDGDVVIQSKLGEFIDHAPVSYSNGKNIRSSFALNGSVQSFIFSQPVSVKDETIIDPWVTNPALTSWNSVYDVDYDKVGNVYGFGGGMNAAYEFVKLTSAGAIQWKFVTTAFGTSYPYYGDFIVDYNSGSTYLFQGFAFTGAGAIKLDQSGTQIASFAGTSALNELWRAKYNCYTNEFIVGGGGTQGNNQGLVLDTTLSTYTPINVYGATGPQHDIALLTIDNAGDAYFVAVQSVAGPFAANQLLKCPAALTPTTYTVSTGQTFNEPTLWPDITYVSNFAGQAIGYNGIAVNNNFLCTYDGEKLKKWNKTTGAALASVTIGNISSGVKYGGLDLSDCDTLYVGVGDQMNIMDQSLVIKKTVTLTDYIYDLKLKSSANIIYACGKGFISEIAISENCNVKDSLVGLAVSSSSCSGGGIANVNVTGGSNGLGYSYSWSNGQTAQTATGLASGTLTVTVTDNYFKKCITQTLFATYTVTVNNPSAPSINSAAITSPLCSTGTGSAIASASGGTGNLTYSWSSGLSGLTATGLNVGLYTLTVTDASGCYATSAVNITSPPPINLSATQTKPDSCGNNTGIANAVVSGGTGLLSYIWSSGATTLTISNVPASTYTITVTDANSCSSTATVTIAAVGAVIPNAGTDAAICKGNSSQLSASGGTNYSWAPPATLSNPLIANPVATPTITTTFTVTISTGSCTGTDVVIITVNPLASITAVTPTNSNCSTGTGSATALVSGGTGSLICNWSNGSTGTTSVSGLTVGTYTVTVTDINNCSSTSTVSITSPPAINVTAVQTKPDSCGKSIGSANATASGGTGALNYLWSTGSTNSQISNLTSQIYSLTVTDANSCTKTTSVLIGSVGSVVAFAGNDAGICILETAQLNASGGTNYSWTPPATLSNPLIANPVATPTVTTNYTVTVSTGGCTGTDVVLITVNPLPSTNAGGDQTITKGTATQLGASGGISFVWTPTTTLNNAGISNPVASPTVTTTYIVTSTDVNGCVNIDSMTVFVVEPINCNDNNVFVPTAFSPNNDGQNDVLYVRGSLCLKTLLFQVFDRWGEKVFETTDVTKGWDGVLRNKLMDAGVFVYTLSATLIDNTEIKRDGNVTLVR